MNNYSVIGRAECRGFESHLRPLKSLPQVLLNCVVYWKVSRSLFIMSTHFCLWYRPMQSVVYTNGVCGIDQYSVPQTEVISSTEWSIPETAVV